jgi:hypothetical protein
MLNKKSRYSTTHIITREYASKIVQTAHLCNKSIFSEEEIKLSTPPFSHGGIRKWGEYNYGEQSWGYDTPLRMDFSNYQIGYIVPDGHSYSDPPEKKKVRRQIYWRIFNLGWSKEKFQDIDGRIQSSNHSYNRTERSHIERYGKKYSWIAYYELSGLREDQGKAERDFYENRTSSVDIDPTFILPPAKVKIINEPFISTENIHNKEWINKQVDYDFEKCLRFQDDSVKLCLNGLVAEINLELMRKMWFFIDALIIKNEDYERFTSLISNGQKKSYQGINASSNHYTFGMEMFVNPALSNENYDTIDFQIGVTQELISKDDIRNLMYSEQEITFEGNNMIIKRRKKKDRIVERPVLESFTYLNPIAKYSWESYHSKFNMDSAQNCLSKELFEALNLITKPQTFDLFDNEGQRVFVNFKEYNNYNDNQYFSFIAKDVLDNYLSKTNSRLIWYVRGENQIHFGEHEDGREFFEEHEVNPYHEFGKFIEYNSDQESNQKNAE